MFKCPDFGFDNLLNFNDPIEEKKKMKNGMSNNWKYVMDFAQMEPRFERVRNYITFVNEKKFNEEATEYSKKNELPI